MGTRVGGRRKPIALAVQALTLLVTAGGCTSHAHPAPAKFGTVTGFVGFVGGALQAGPARPRPLPGAKIELTSSGRSATATAGKDGRYSIQVIPGQYTLALVDGGPCQTTSAVATGGKVTTADLICNVL